ncbi:MAG: RagB/SusD family nutrient uptake outer membrane protein [Bacteroidales bacterium]|nr:RagB/SusD family nutrient uptake outer membrane protein [Bacteroidales bacterium]
MKRIFIIILSAVVLAFTGCNKDEILDGNPYTSFVKSNYFTSETNVELFANYFYSEWAGYGNSGSYGSFYFPSLNDNQAPTGYTEWNFTSVSATNGTWNACYQEIRRANTLIEALPTIESMSDASKKNWEGLARLYRAWQHYCLVRTFGDCYYVDTVLDSSDEEVLYGPRQDRDVVMDKVLEDLNFAVANITANASSRTAYNAAVAQAIKSEICLYEGTFCKYRSSSDGQKDADPSRASKYLTECKTASQVIMNNSMYALSPSYRAVYNSLDLAESEATKEMILYKKYVDGILGHSVIDYTCGSTQTVGMTKDAFDSYLFRDGEALANTSLNKDDHGKKVAIKSGTFADDRDYVVSIKDALDNRDPRLSESIDSVLFYPGMGYKRYALGAEATSSTGYGVMKFDTPKFTDATARNSIGRGATDAPIFWLGNIILNYAEACAETGEDAAAVSAINQLRSRAGMPNLSSSPKADPANNMGVSNLIWEVRRERRVELMFDNNDRYWSLIRWHQLDKLDQTNYPNLHKGAWIGEFKTEGIDVDSNGYIETLNNTSGRKYDKKYYLAPIPSGQITLNPQIGQNPGW